MELYKRISEVNIPYPYFAADLAKSRFAAKFIGSGTPGSKTYAYMVAADDLANVGIYLPGERVMVSVEGARKNRVAVDANEISLATRSRVTFATDTREESIKPYNVGERELATLLLQFGYMMIAPGIWGPGAVEDVAF